MSILSRLFGKAPKKNGEPTPEEPLVPVPIPALCVLLNALEKRKGSPLTQEEVLDIRDNAVCMAMPFSIAKKFIEARGYDDLNTENIWEEWQELRRELSPEGETTPEPHWRHRQS